MNQQTLVRTAAGIVLILVFAFLAWQETIGSSTAVALIVAVAGSIGLYERGLRKPQP